MMTRVLLAAGVAALAIAAPANAGPKADREAAKAERAERVKAARADRPQRAERVQARAERPARVERQARAERPARVERQQVRAERPARVERQQVRAERPARVQRAERPARVERQQMRAERPARVERAERPARVQRAERPARIERAERPARVDRVQNRVATQDLRAQRQVLRADRQAANQDLRAQRQELRFERQARQQDLQAQRQDLRALRNSDTQVFRTSSLASVLTPQTRIVAPAVASQLIGVPVTTASTMLALSPLPQSISYLYPDTSDYYYRYGNGYLYGVERESNLISWLLPLLAGGFMPGQYLPASYMNSYVPNHYGLNSFYADSPYECNRYYNGVIYQVDCVTGMVEDVIPLYASGYGVGQMLPSSYGYYNVPTQYRSLYYDTPDYGYWYAPGAIYQYDQSSSLITSVAALLTPGFSIGQPMPMGYDVYNVPYAYRQTYYDTPNAWYRYNNGSIYQIDPTTQLVTAIVASLLT